MSGQREPWTMPEWMEPYRELIGNTGGNSIEELMNDQHTNAQSNLIRSALIISVTSQVGLLHRLMRAGHLLDRDVFEQVRRYAEEIQELYYDDLGAVAATLVDTVFSLELTDPALCGYCRHHADRHKYAGTDQPDVPCVQCPDELCRRPRPQDKP